METKFNVAARWDMPTRQLVLETYCGHLDCGQPIWSLEKGLLAVDDWNNAPFPAVFQQTPTGHSSVLLKGLRVKDGEILAIDEWDAVGELPVGLNKAMELGLGAWLYEVTHKDLPEYVETPAVKELNEQAAKFLHEADNNPWFRWKMAGMAILAFAVPIVATAVSVIILATVGVWLVSEAVRYIIPFGISTLPEYGLMACVAILVMFLYETIKILMLNLLRGSN